jgi:hypothetical protein
MQSAYSLLAIACNWPPMSPVPIEDSHVSALAYSSKRVMTMEAKT